jgi:hypothetical protein
MANPFASSGRRSTFVRDGDTCTIRYGGIEFSRDTLRL